MWFRSIAIILSALMFFTSVPVEGLFSYATEVQVDEEEIIESNDESIDNSEKEYITITFDANGGLFGDEHTLVIKIEKGEGLVDSLDIPTNSDETLVFKGWYEYRECTKK